MANLKSSTKDAKRSKVWALRNKARLSEVKTVRKKVLEEIASGNLDEAGKAFVLAQSKISRAVGKGVIKKNTASRKVARLAKKLKLAGQEKSK